MVICAGPTGSGKTTTLYGSLGEINSPDRNIMTIEDPVEYTFPSINQIQINEQAGITFAGGLKSILRQDPDVILNAMGGRTPEGGFVRGAGCNFCGHTGYLERIGVYELMTVSDSIRELI